MAHNEDAKEYITHYLDPNNKCDFAILLDGAWGSGKTHFIKSLLGERDAMAKRSDPLAGPSYLYASLYGVKLTREITDQFFAQAHPVLNSRAARILGSSISGAAHLFTGAKLSESGASGDVVKDMVLKLEGRILVFDDLERSSMPISEAMGFINSCVEHEGLKVIVVANQAEIPPDQKAEYNRRREKLVGKTLQVGSSPEDVFDIFVDHIVTKAAHTAANNSKEAVLRTFAASGKNNFRSLRAVFSDFSRLVSHIDVRVQASPEALNRLLLYMVATGLEFRAGSLSVEELSELSREVSVRRFDKISPSTSLMTRYQDVEWSNPIVPPTCLVHLYETGIVDAVRINDYVLQHPIVVGYKSAPAWRRLWNWTDLSRQQYEETRGQLLAELKAHELVHPGIILQVAGEIISLASWDDHLLGKETDIISYFDEYLRELLTKRQLLPVRDGLGLEWDKDSYAGLAYPSRVTTPFKTILELVQKATLEAFSLRMRTDAPSLLKRLQSAVGENYSVLYEFGLDKGNYADCPILHYLKVDDFADLMTEDSRPVGRLFASLGRRYEIDEHSGSLAAEHEWLEKLERELSKRASHAPTPQRELIGSRIKYYFSRIQKLVTAAKTRKSESPGEES